MAEVTASSMHDARDAEDTRLLAAGEHGALIESYYETIIQRCRARCRAEDDALDCAQAVFVRLLAELRRGRRYAVPYRVVVHKVIEWTTKGFYERGRAVIVEFDDDLPEEVFGPADPYADVETRYDPGERPDVHEHLERACAEREELGRLFDSFLEAMPARDPTGGRRPRASLARAAASV